MRRTFTLAHKDGRRWTSQELDGAVARERYRFGQGPVNVHCEDFAVGCIGVIYLIDGEGMAWSFNERRDDMVVVFDD